MSQSRGPTALDLTLKPDLLAPGNRIIAATTPTTKLKGLVGNNNVNCGNGCDEHYVELSGTSMAASIVSGTVASMLATTAPPPGL